MKSNICIIGTNGIPASYGGFETLAEHLVLNLSSRLSITVYCSNKFGVSPNEYVKSIQLVRFPLSANGYQAPLYDMLSFLHAIFNTSTILYLGPVAGFMVPIARLFGVKVVTNHGGLNEWERPKLSALAKKYSFINHKIAARYSTVNIADNSVLSSSLATHFDADSVVIRYGGNHVSLVGIDEWATKYPFIEKDYFISVSRAQEDNNLHVILEAFLAQPDHNLVLVSNWNSSQYGIDLFKRFSNIKNIFLVQAVYAADELNALRSNAKCYIHSHSLCGTAPSLVEAICLGLPILSYDVPQNRETLDGNGLYFNTSEELEYCVNNLSEDWLNMERTLMSTLSFKYSWEHISEEYFKIL